MGKRMEIRLKENFVEIMRCYVKISKGNSPKIKRKFIVNKIDQESNLTEIECKPKFLHSQ